MKGNERSVKCENLRKETAARRECSTVSNVAKSSSHIRTEKCPLGLMRRKRHG